MTDQEQGRQRSPAYPYLDLPESIDLMVKFYELHKNGHIPISIALKELGWSSTSGSGVRVIAALTQFGLFETEGARDARRIWVSTLGKSILWDNPRDPTTRINALREAALKPDMHQWVHTRYELNQNALPSNAVMLYDLVHEKGFAEVAASAFIKELRSTFDYAQLPETSESQAQEPPTETRTADWMMDPIAMLNTPTRQAPTEPRTPPVNTESREYTIGLTNRKVARLILPMNMNRRDFELIKQHADLLSQGEFYDEESEENNLRGKHDE